MQSFMKTYKIYLALSAVALMLLGCKDDEQEVVVPTITEVSLTEFPGDDTFIALDPAGTDSLKIYWNASSANDGTLVMYAVQFDEAEGDFSTPVGTYVTRNVGMEQNARIIHKFLNIYAENAGIEQLSKGKLKWRVVATTGVGSVYSGAHVIEVERPLGIAEIPDDLFITGDATEGGADALKGLPFKKITEVVNGVEKVKKGEFEIYTSLGAGMFRFASSNTKAPVVFYHAKGNKIVKNGQSGSPVSERKPYHIYVNFNTGVVTMSEIISVGLWHGASSSVFAELTYKNNGVWSATDMSSFTTGTDNRYKFKMTKKSVVDGSLSDVFWGSAQIAPSPPSGSVASYYYLVAKNDFSQYDYSFRFSNAAVDRPLDIDFVMTSSAVYTHRITIK
jgi:starch-binding outer membrane protein SusE/F